MDLRTLAVNIVSMITLHGLSYGPHEKGGGYFWCYNRQDCRHQNPKRTGIGIELRGSGVSGIACSCFLVLRWMMLSL